MGWLKKQLKKIKKSTAKIGAVVGAVTGIGVVAGIAGSLLISQGSSSSNTNKGSVSGVVNDTNVYIPAMSISFEGNLFKPNTRLYVFFDGRDVSQYIQPDGGATGNPLTTDSSGHIKGVFHLPNTSTMKFIQGKKELKFTDSSKNDSSETTYSVTYFTYSGSEDKTGSQDAGGTQASTNRADPLVQTFFVLDRGGIYLKSVNLYFLTKDNKFPVLFQIREVIEDTVSDLYLTNSNYIISPANINTSTDGSVATTINFASPVYLQEGKEYAIYLVTNAPGTYSLASCIYGETDSYNQLSTRDPRIGSIMKNLSSSSWLKDSSKGLKFILHKCAFDTTKKYILALDNQDLLTNLLDNNSLYTTATTNKITVKDPNHGFNPNDFVTISGLPADTDYAGINSNYINGIHRIDEVTNESYSFTTVLINGSETVIPSQATASIHFGVNIVTDTSYQYDTIYLNNSEILLSNTKLDYTFKGLSGKSLDGSETPNVFDPSFTEISNQLDYNTSKVKKINSPYNERNLNPGSAKSLQVNVEFSTNNENISPTIDVGNTNAVLIENIINDPDPEELQSEITDNDLKGLARYITRDVTLSAQSNGIQVRFEGNLQGSANIRIYYKILPIQSTGTLLEQPWVEMIPDQEVAKSMNDTTFNDYRYTAYGLPLFKAFKTKVLMTSPDSTKAPLIKRYQAIAFQSIENE